MPKKKEEREKDIYTKEGVEELIENDEIDLIEEAFMEGYLMA